MNTAYINLILNIAEIALEKLANDKELQSQILSGSETIVDWLQVKLGKVNNRGMKQSIQLAIDTSIVRDESKICSIIATITTLYATNNIDRDAIVGGTLLSEFGDEVFPHINERELRFAKPINKKVYDHILISINDSFHEKMNEFDFKKHADFSDLEQASWFATSAYTHQTKLEFIMNHGVTAFKFIKNLIK